MNLEKTPRTALVLAGGGTRGAYEVGIIHYIRTMLPRPLARGLRFHILCGSSVGAINSTFMAGTAQDPELQGRELVRLWLKVRNEDIYQTGAASLGKFLVKSFFGILMHSVGIRGLTNPDDLSLQFRGIFDTSPFSRFLLRGFHWSNISKNLDSGLIDAVTVSATNLVTGDLELFLQKREDVPHSERIITRLVKISPRHVMASAALPLLFPPVPIHGSYYNDGGMRLNTPLAPAVALGANRIMIIGTRYIKAKTPQDIMLQDTQARAMNLSLPTFGEILGKFFNAVLLDRIHSDRDQVDRINRILDKVAKNTTAEQYERICEEASVKRIETIAFFPSVDIHQLVDETVRGSYHRVKSFSIFERFILRVLEADPRRGRDLLSYFLFEPTYLKKMIDLGFEDARKKHDEICTFAEGSIRERPAV